MSAALPCSLTTVWLLYMQPDRPSTPPGFACPPGAEPGGNWVQGSEYASSLNQPPHPKLCTAFQPAHPSWIGRDWNSTPFFCSPCFFASPSNPSLHYALSCRPAAAAAHMIRASTQPPVLSSLPPGQQHPIDPSSQALYSASQ